MKARYLFIASLCLLPTVVLAHPGHDGGHGFMSGLLHPWSGMDHLITMVAVGMWAAQLGGRMRWAVPASFVGMMLVGAMLGFGNVHLSAVEQCIAASVCVLGLLLACAVRLPLIASVALVGSFAVFHGYAHALEASRDAHAVMYMTGFALSTMLLHAVGFITGMQFSRYQYALRWVGAAIALSGVAMLVA